MDEYELAPLDEPQRSAAPIRPIADEGAGAAGLPAVPFDPPHHCPVCDYNLGGLTHRTCPECGGEFDLREARSAAAGGQGMYDAADLRVVKAARARMITGAVLIAIGFGAPVIWSGGQRSVSFWVLVLIALPFFLIVVSSVASDWDWSTVVLLWGLVALMTGGTMIALAL